MYTAGVLPVGQQRYTATIITTTPNKNGSYIMDQARKIDSNRNPLLPQLLLGDPCKECKARGEYMCPHKSAMVPWKSDENRRDWGFMYEENKEVDQMENYNYVQQNTNFCFLPEEVERLKRREPKDLFVCPTLVTLSIDASGGGSDEYSIKATYTDSNRNTIILFMDSAVVPNANQTLVEQRLLYAVKAIRSINMLAHVPILIAAEAKFGPTGGTVMYMFDILKKHYGENIGEIHIMCESGPHRNPGVPKDPKRTQEMVNLSRRQMRFDRVYFSRHLKVGLSNDQTVEGNKDKLFDQMRKFILKKITKDGSTADIRWKWEGEEGHDDMMITFLMGIYWEDQFWLSNYPPYVAWRNKIGAR